MAGKEKGHSPQKAAAAPALLPLAQEQPPPCSPERCVTPAPCLAGGSEPLQMLGAVAACSGTRPPSRGMQQGDQHQGETPARRGNAASSTPARPPHREDCHSMSLLGDMGNGTWPAVCAVLVRGRLRTVPIPVSPGTRGGLSTERHRRLIRGAAKYLAGIFLDF